MILPGVISVYFAGMLLFFPVVVSAIYAALHTEFVVQDGVLMDVDLWNVESVRYGRHCVYLDKVCIEGVPDPQKFIESLEDYYTAMTGVVLP